MKGPTTAAIQNLERKTNLFEELIIPIVKAIKRLHHIDIIDKNTAICSSIKCNTKALKPLLTCCVPNLMINHSNFKYHQRTRNQPGHSKTFRYRENPLAG